MKGVQILSRSEIEAKRRVTPVSFFYHTMRNYGKYTILIIGLLALASCVISTGRVQLAISDAKVADEGTSAAGANASDMVEAAATSSEQHPLKQQPQKQSQKQLPTLSLSPTPSLPPPSDEPLDALRTDIPPREEDNPATEALARTAVVFESSVRPTSKPTSPKPTGDPPMRAPTRKPTTKPTLKVSARLPGALSVNNVTGMPPTGSVPRASSLAGGIKQRRANVLTPRPLNVAILIIGENRVLNRSPGHVFLKHKLAQLIEPLRAESKRTELFMCTDGVLPVVSTFLNATAWHVASGNGTCGGSRGSACNGMFRRARSCFEYVQGWSSARRFSFDYFVRDRPDTVLMRPVPPIKCLPDRSAVYAPPRFVGEQLFPGLCSSEQQRARRERIARTGLHSWLSGRAGGAYRESCSNGYSLQWRAPLNCVTISDEFAIIPAASAASYFADSWFGMSDSRETPSWGRDPKRDPATSAHCCLFMGCRALAPQAFSKGQGIKWAPEGVLTRQLFLGGATIGVLEMDTAHIPWQDNHMAGLVWRWLRSNAATSLRDRDVNCNAMYPTLKSR